MPAAADPRAGLSEDYVAQFKRDVLSCERTLLHTIAFDLIIPPNPMKFAEAKIKLAASAVPQELYDSFCVKTFVFLKFAMRTSLCLQFPPSYLTAATVGSIFAHSCCNCIVIKEPPWLNITVAFSADVTSDFFYACALYFFLSQSHAYACPQLRRATNACAFPFAVSLFLMVLRF